MANFSVDIKGIPEVKRYLNTKDKNIGIEIKKGIFKSTIYLQGKVKDSIAGREAEYPSVDTGRFLNSVDPVVGNMEGAVVSRLPYARKLEFGTNFKNSPRKHFRNSANRSKEKIQAIIATQIKNI